MFFILFIILVKNGAAHMRMVLFGVSFLFCTCVQFVLFGFVIWVVLLLCGLQLLLCLFLLCAVLSIRGRSLCLLLSSGALRLLSGLFLLGDIGFLGIRFRFCIRCLLRVFWFVFFLLLWRGMWCLGVFSVVVFWFCRFYGFVSWVVSVVVLVSILMFLRLLFWDFEVFVWLFLCYVCLDF